MAKNIFSLDGEWNLSFTLPIKGEHHDIKIEVPSNPEPRLFELGIIGDYLLPDDDRCAEELSFVDDWCYEKEFDAPCFADNSARVLVFGGIDTVCEIYLNGELLGTGCDMHKSYRFDVTDKLSAIGNRIKVIIRSPELYARRHPHDMMISANSAPSFYDSRAYLRKARHSWGWDNAPRLMTSGLWRSVYIEEVATERFDEVYFFTKETSAPINRGTARGAVIGATYHYSTDRLSLKEHRTRLSLLDGDRAVAVLENKVYHTVGTLRFEIPEEDIELWWPKDLGEPKLYTLRLEMLEGERIAAKHESPFGIRTVKLSMTENIVDGEGDFCFIVNGERVFIRGTNWKPLSPLPSLADEKTRNGAALSEILNLNCNMVRIWGGGIYEDEAFFDFCDKNGILIWQDFMLACELPPADEDFCRLIKTEAEEVIKRYRNHPSLAIWCADNENDESLSWTTWGSQILPSHSKISRQILKDAVIHNDPYRCYVPSSPFVSDENYKERCTGKIVHHTPETHFYPSVLNYKALLRELKSRFIGEGGPIITNSAAPNPRIFEKEKERLKRLWNAELTPTMSTNAHQEDGYLIAWRKEGAEFCRKLYGRDFSFDEWGDFVTALNLGCAEIFKDIIEFCRTHREHKTGVIWWSLMDMWDMAFNYSVIDSDGLPKLAYHWIKQSQEPITLISSADGEGEEVLYGANDTLSDEEISYTVTAYDEEGSGVIIASGEEILPKNSTRPLTKLDIDDDYPLLILTLEAKGEQVVNHYIKSMGSYERARKMLYLICDSYGVIPEELK